MTPPEPETGRCLIPSKGYVLQVVSHGVPMTVEDWWLYWEEGVDYD